MTQSADPAKPVCRCRGSFHSDRCPEYLANCKAWQEKQDRDLAEREAHELGLARTRANVEQMEAAAQLLADVMETELAEQVRAVAGRLRDAAVSTTS